MSERITCTRCGREVAFSAGSCPCRSNMEAPKAAVSDRMSDDKREWWFTITDEAEPENDIVFDQAWITADPKLGSEMHDATHVVPAADLLAAQAEIERLNVEYTRMGDEAASAKMYREKAERERDEALAALRETFHAGVYVLDCPRPSLDNAFARLSAVLKRTEALLAKMKREG